VQKLTPKVVNESEPGHLHRFQWLDDSEIGNLDIGWNYLEGWYPPAYDKLKAVHYTLGGPWFEHKKDCDFEKEWTKEHMELQLVKNSSSKSHHTSPGAHTLRESIDISRHYCPVNLRTKLIG